jgi:hypothetical protein
MRFHSPSMPCNQPRTNGLHPNSRNISCREVLRRSPPPRRRIKRACTRCNGFSRRSTGVKAPLSKVGPHTSEQKPKIMKVNSARLRSTLHVLFLSRHKWLVDLVSPVDLVSRAPLNLLTSLVLPEILASLGFPPTLKSLIIRCRPLALDPQAYNPHIKQC